MSGPKRLILVPVTSSSGSSEAPILVMPSSTLLLQPVSSTSSQPSLILVPTSQGGSPASSRTENSNNLEKKKKNSPELPRPKWGANRLEDKIKMLNEPSPYQDHLIKTEKGNVEEGKPAEEEEEGEKAGDESFVASPREEDPISPNAKIPRIEKEEDEKPEMVREEYRQPERNHDREEEEPDEQLSPAFYISDVQKDPFMNHYYTGFRTYESFKTFYSLMDLQEFSFIPSKAPNSRLTRNMEFLMCIIKLRRNKDFQELGFFFNVSPKDARFIFETWIEFLYWQSQKFTFWISKEEMDILLSFKDICPFSHEFVRVLKEDKKKVVLHEELSAKLIRVVERSTAFHILTDSHMDSVTERFAPQIAHVCLSIANFFLISE